MKKHKPTWVDGLVLAVVLLLIAGTAVKFLYLDGTRLREETTSFQYQLLIHGVRSVTVDALAVGDTVYDNEGKGAVGVISDIRVEDALSSITLPDGTIVEGPMEDRYDVTLTLDAEGQRDGRTYKIGTYTIKVNQSSTYFTKYSIWTAKILSMD